MFVIRLQIAFLYFQAAIEKAYQRQWNNGTAMYYWLNDYQFGLNDFLKPFFAPILESSLLLFLSSWLVIIFELILAVGIMLKQQYKYLLFGVAFLFHFLIVIIHGLGTFWLSMTGALILFLFDFEKTFLENLKLLTLEYKKLLTPIRYAFSGKNTF